MGIDEFLELIRQWAAERWPGRPAVSVVLKLADGRKVKFSLPDVPYKPTAAWVAPPAPGVPPPAPGVAPPISRTERRVLEAVARMDVENPTGEEVAAAAKLPYEPHFKKKMADLRARGFLGGRKGEAGYSITPLGLAAIEPVGGGE